MNLKNDESMTSKPTNLGSIFGLLLIVVLAGYSYQKVSIFYEKKKFDILQTSIEGHYPEEYVFSWDSGFNIAVAFTAYDNERENILDPSIGELGIYISEWGDENGELFLRDIKLDTHQCSREELGLEGNDSSFFPTVEKNVQWVKLYQKKFICMNRKDAYVQGN